MFDLKQKFLSGAANTPYAANDDCTSQFFSPSEVAKLSRLILPHIYSGRVTGFEFQDGFESGLFMVRDKRRGSHNTILCVTVHQGPDMPRKFTANVSDIKLNLETINFDEVVRNVRYALNTLFSDAPAPKASLSLV